MTTNDIIEAWVNKNLWATGWDEELRRAGKAAEKSSDAFEKLASAIKKEVDERKEEKMVYHVKFEGTERLYAYYCAPGINLQIGSSYMIEADRATNYKNPVTVMRIDNNVPKNVNVRTITHARLLSGTKRPDDKIKQVIFNHEKRTTVVLWYDGQKTIVKCQDGDVFDEEKALALCYMKRVLGNRGSFNETLRKWTNTNT